MNVDLTSGLAEDMASMLDFRKAMGLSTEMYIYHCRLLDCFCSKHYPLETELSEEIVLGWLQLHQDGVNVLNHRASFIRILAKYIISTGKCAYVLPSKFIAPQKPYVPYILSDKELTALFCAIDDYPSNARLDALQPALFSTIFRLIYTCGLRPNEGRTLRCEHVYLDTGEILITKTKKHKDRMVVMSDEMRELAKRYAKIRDIVHTDSPYFFPSKSGNPYTEKMLGWHFSNFIAMANPSIEKQMLPRVRIYDLRHRFATTVMLKWIDERRNLYNALPYLSMYMGHAKLSQTAYYIQLIPDNLRRSHGIDWKSMGALIPEVIPWER